MKPLTPELYQQVCDLLFDVWDPIGVNGIGGPRDEYDSYAAGLIRLVRAGADESEVTEHLSRLSRITMGLSHVDEDRDRNVARSLHDLVNG
jgi:hypothetical protein